MKILFFDTETTGLPLDYDEPFTNVKNWPRLVQLSWILEETQTNEVTEHDFIIEPVGFIIPFAATKIHHITHDWAERNGKPIKSVLHRFDFDILQADLLVGHNIEFDLNIVAAEFYRLKKDNRGVFGTGTINAIIKNLLSKPKFCTMLNGTNYTKIEVPYQDEYKWPKLAELYRYFFGYDFKGAHNSLDDIRATRECFWEMERLNSDEFWEYIKKSRYEAINNI